MKRLMVRTAFLALLLSTRSHAQSGAVIPQAGTGQASQGSCIILKHMGRGDRTKSLLYSLGTSGKQFRYVEGKLPEGFSLHHKMTDQDVRNLQARGAQVLVLDSNYTSEDLQKARTDCHGETGKTPNQVEAKASPAPAPIASSPATTPNADDSASFLHDAESAGSTPAPTTKPPNAKPPTAMVPTPKAEDSPSPEGTTVAALLDVSSTPTEADVYIDERLSGRTPATLILMPGDHKLVIKKNGFVVWMRKFNLPSGRSNVDAELLPKAK